MNQATAPAEPVNEPAASNSTAQNTPQQQEMPLALVYGQPMLQMPQDLYIPPDALEVILEAFEGPLDLLLYLIRRQNLDILDIPVAEITRQYIGYIEVMQELKLELAAEYLVMAAILAEIKSRMLLPRPPSEEGTEDDPRADLVRRLQEYERFKTAAQNLDGLPRMERDTDPAHAFVPDRSIEREPPKVELRELLLALSDVLRRAELFSHHAIKREALSVRQRMAQVLERLSDGQFHDFLTLFVLEEGRLGVVVSFLSILELAKEGLIEIVQEEFHQARQGEPAHLAPIYLRALATAPNALSDSAETFDGDEPATEPVDDSNA